MLGRAAEEAELGTELDEEVIVEVGEASPFETDGDTSVLVSVSDVESELTCPLLIISYYL